MTISRRILSLAALTALGALSNAPAQAATTVPTYAAATLMTTINVLNVCYFTTQSYTDTYSYDPINVNQTAATTPQPVTLAYQCTTGDATDYFLFDNGSNAGGTLGRQALSGTNKIAYGIYSNSTATALITSTTHVAGATGTGILSTALNTTVYVASPGGQNVAAGTYTDTVNITVTP